MDLLPAAYTFSFLSIRKHINTIGRFYPLDLFSLLLNKLIYASERIHRVHITPAALDYDDLLGVLPGIDQLPGKLLFKLAGMLM